MSVATRDLDIVVRGDDFMVAGCGEDLDWLSQKLSEKLELAQKARLGHGCVSEATVLNRCVTYSDSWLTWEADPRHTELAEAELGLQLARLHKSPSGAKPNTHLDGAWQSESQAQCVSDTGIPPTRHRIHQQGMQSCSRESNTC